MATHLARPAEDKVLPGAAEMLKVTVDDIFADARASVVCLVPTLLSTGLVFAAIYTLTNALTSDDATSWFHVSEIDPETVGPIILGGIFVAVLAVTGWVWTALAWHRMIALGEKPGWALPKWPGGRMLGYLGRSILIGLLIGVLAATMTAIGGLFAPELAATSSEVGFDQPQELGLFARVLQFVIGALLYGIYLRLALILPAQALGQPLNLHQAWEATRGGHLRLFLPLGVLLAVVEFVFTLISSLVSFGGVFDVLAFGVMTLVGIGVLTRLYLTLFPSEAPPA
jgi:hypothetical protein